MQPGWDGDRPPALKFDDERKARFLAVLEEHGMVTAARAAAVTTDTVYKHRKADEAFAKAWEEAYTAYCDRLEMERTDARSKALTSPCSSRARWSVWCGSTPTRSSR